MAEDITSHSVNRGYRGKGMVVSIDKATAVRTYDKVRVYWEQCSGVSLGAVTQVKTVTFQPVGNLVFPEADGGLEPDVGNQPTADPGVDCLGVHLEARFQVLRRKQLRHGYGVELVGGGAFHVLMSSIPSIFLSTRWK